MKYIYIFGLEHSGTTLTNFLLSKLPNALGLGEVAQFFNPQHMHVYMRRWGKNDDARLCSCLKDWSDCEFWSEVETLNGLESDMEMMEKYDSLFKYIQSKYSENEVIIDSSKRLDVIKNILDNYSSLDSPITSIKLIFAVKDPREFAMSIIRKNSSKSLWAVFKTFNWWYSINKQNFEYYKANKELVSISPYKVLCHEPSTFLKTLARKINVESEGSIDNYSNSHIAMGNKNFALRNHEYINYDDDWCSIWQIKVVNFLHYRARRLYQKIYKAYLQEA